MATQQSSYFYNQILPEMPGVETVLVDQWINNMMIELCEASQIWVVDADPLTIVANTATYAAVPPAALNVGGVNYADVAQIKTLWVGQTLLRPTSYDELEQWPVYWPTQTADMPMAYFMPTQNTVTLVPIPTNTSGYQLNMKHVLRPAAGTNYYQDWIAVRYLQEIGVGVKARLMQMVGKPWSNPTRAQMLDKDWSASLLQARADGDRAFTRTRRNIRIPRYDGRRY